MVLPLTSRFAVLSVDDDDDDGAKKTKNLAKRNADQSKQLPNQLKKKNKKPDTQSNQQYANQQVAKNKTKPNQNQRKKKAVAADQWEMWKEKDAQMQDGAYENELQQAMLLSKLDFEEKKDVYNQLKKQQDHEKKNTANSKKKKGKPQPMSLSEFNSLPDSLVRPQEAGGGDTVSVNGQPESDPEFFERVQLDAKKAISNEKAAEQRKAREPFVNDAITIAKFEVQIDKKNKECLELKKEITRLKEEIQDVKQRNKTLCQILGEGEMKDKAKVLVQMEKTQKVKDELSSEVARLTALLEQERSKVRALTGDKIKGKNKKRIATDNH